MSVGGWNLSSTEQLMDKDMLYWGVGSYLAANIGHFGTIFLLEVIIWFGNVKSYFIEYGVRGKSHKPRMEAIQGTLKKVPYMEQWKVATFNMVGPMAMLNSLVMGYVMPKIIGPVGDEIPGWETFLLHYILLHFIDDFFLYWFHRIEHEYLWDFHKYHHTIDTPTAISTVCIDSFDATLQAAIPLFLSALIVRPHPLTFAAHITARLAENVANHSGMDHWFINLVLLKVLPGRAGVAHHDSHHKYSNYAGSNAKNLAEFYWVYDWMFGTLGTSQLGEKGGKQA